MRLGLNTLVLTGSGLYIVDETDDEAVLIETEDIPKFVEYVLREFINETHNKTD